MKIGEASADSAVSQRMMHVKAAAQELYSRAIDIYFNLRGGFSLLAGVRMWF